MSEKSSALAELLGSPAEKASLGCEELQKNSRRQKGVGTGERKKKSEETAQQDGYRIPTAVATMPEQGLVAVGFDSGEVQCYSGLPGELRVGSGFRVSPGAPVLFLRTLERGGTDDTKMDGESKAVFYVSCGADVILWLAVDGEVRFPWIRYSPTPSHAVTDALLCPGMPKMVAATDKGKLLLFDGRPPAGWKYQPESNGGGEKSEANGGGEKHDSAMGEIQKVQIVKVAHEGPIHCLSTDADGDLLLSAGADGRVCLWLWGHDQFLHQAASIFLTNIPVRAAFFLNESDEYDDDADGGSAVSRARRRRHTEEQQFVLGEEFEAALTLDTHVMGLRATRKSRQVFKVEQTADRHFVMTTEGGRVSHQRGLQPILHCTRRMQERSPMLLLALRSGSRVLEVVGDDVSVAATNRSSQCVAFDHRRGGLPKYDTDEDDERKQVVTAAALLGKDGKPEVRFWVKK